MALVNAASVPSRLQGHSCSSTAPPPPSLGAPNRQQTHFNARISATGSPSPGEPPPTRKPIVPSPSSPDPWLLGERSTPPPPPPASPAQLSPTGLIWWAGTLPPSRRVVVSGLLGGSVALGSNFLGCTSALLGVNAEESRKRRLDVVYPVQGFRRHVDSQYGFEFLYPAAWQPDQGIASLALQGRQQGVPLDPPPLQRDRTGRPPPPLTIVYPVAAYKPSGGVRGLNMSAVVAPVAGDFRLSSVGESAEAVARWILKTIIAPEGSILNASLLGCSKKTVALQEYYDVEFLVEGPTYLRHNRSLFSVWNGFLVTLNTQAPELVWINNNADFSLVLETLTFGAL